MKVIIDIPDGTKFLGIGYAIDNGNLTITAGTRAYTNISQQTIRRLMSYKDSEIVL